jgi:2-oxoglutarate dehydrogenase E1 component
MSARRHTIFANTSFLYGGNAAYSEDLYAKYEADPAAVDAEWRAFFQSLKDEKADVVKSARGASWKKPNWPVRANGDRVAPDGQWAKPKRDQEKSRRQRRRRCRLSADVLQATHD